MEPLISIIIPFHNEEAYLSRAVMSAVNQSYHAIEVILVNDASTDGSLSIAENLQSIYRNIQIININGYSLGAARNAGIAASRGLYISFLDADDVLRPDAVRHLYASIIEHHADVSIGKFKMINDAITSKKSIGWKSDEATKTGMEAALGMYQFQIVYTVWAKLFKADIVKQIPFVENIWFEDRVFMLSYFLKTNLVSFVDEVVLEYESRPDSISRRLISTKRITDIFEVYQLELAIIKSSNYEPSLKKAIDRHEINAFLENLIFLYLDRNKINNSNELQQCFASKSKAFLQQLKINKSGIGKRDRLDVLLIKLYSMLGWKITFTLLPILKQTKCKSIAGLRTS